MTRNGVNELKLKIPILVIILLVGTSLTVNAYTLQNSRYGDPMFSTNSRLLGMGGAGVASSGAASAVENPALLAWLEGWDVEITPAFVNSDEARSFPIHDSFDGVIAYNTYAKNTTLYDRYIGGVAVKLMTSVEPAFGVFYSTRYDMNYCYHVERRDPESQSVPQDQVIARKTIESDGGIEAISGAAGVKVLDRVGLGVSVDYVFADVIGTEELRYAVSDSAEEYDYKHDAEWDFLDGIGFTIGVAGQPHPRVLVSMRYQSEVKLEGDWKAKYDNPGTDEDSTAMASISVTYPDKVSLGIKYMPRAELRTTIAAQADYTNWSDLEDSIADDPGTEDTWTFRFGVEHTFYNDVSARFGFIYDEDYMDSEITSSAFTFGVGYPIRGVDFDFGGMVRTRDYRDGDNRIAESLVAGLVTFSYAF
jgi:hypothetical protein